jgi:hypothetical protein
VCFVVHKTNSELECAIFATLYFVGAENIDTYNVVLVYMPKPMDLKAICFKYHNQIKHHLIGFQTMNLGTA